MARTPRKPLAVAPALDADTLDADTWFVESQSIPGTWRKVARDAAGRWSCGCPWAVRSAEQLGVSPCAHLSAVAEHLAGLAAVAS